MLKKYSAFRPYKPVMLKSSLYATALGILALNAVPVLPQVALARSSASFKSSSSFSSTRSSKSFSAKAPTSSSTPKQILRMNEKASASEYKKFRNNAALSIAAGTAAGVAVHSASETHASSGPSGDDVKPQQNKAAEQSVPNVSPSVSNAAPVVNGSPSSETSSANGGGKDRVVVVHDNHDASNDGSSQYLAGFVSGLSVANSNSSHNHDKQGRDSQAPTSSTPVETSPSSVQTPVQVPVPNPPQPAITGSQVPTFFTGMVLLKIILFLILFAIIGLGAYIYYKAKNRSGVSSVGKALKKKLSGDEDVGETSSSPVLPALPLVRIGSSITVPVMGTSSDPSLAGKVPDLDFEPSITGQTSITGIGVIEDQPDTAVLYTDPNLEDQFRVYLDESGKIYCASFLSQLAIYTADSDQWDAWLNKNDGLLGQPDIEHDGKKWLRSMLPQKEGRIEPVCEFEAIHSLIKNEPFVSRWRHEYMLYERDTGYSPGFPQKEFMLIRCCSAVKQGEDYMFLQILGGVEVEPSSLDLTTG